MFSVQAYLSAFGDLGSPSRANMRHSVHVTSALHPGIRENQETWHCHDLSGRATSFQYNFMNEDCGHPPLPPKKKDQVGLLFNFCLLTFVYLNQLLFHSIAFIDCIGMFVRSILYTAHKYACTN